ncbi:hypothetical protein FQV39_28635 [Bosea sp. F3-2]|uniref:phage regulatory CII family protein n=1 Tax=Bosea sp. F3-2 TaxID=2599640 RepID=UPI0011EDA878|nr:phage regulatory CII family protein [Bosea sp. F3-2]QEL26132.1 hypothetical protein FQV39_28635 [Bosea sp. F3-2]
MSDIALPDGLLPLLKTASRALVNACAAPGQTGPQRVEALTGYSLGQISKWQSESAPDLIPIHIVAVLEAATGKPIVTRMLASLTGHGVAPISDEIGSAGDLMLDVVRITGSHARFTTAAAEALEDQKLTPGEVKALLKSAMAHVDQMTALIGRLAPLVDA